MKASDLIKELVDSILEYGDLTVADDCAQEIFIVMINNDENCGIEPPFFMLDVKE